MYSTVLYGCILVYSCLEVLTTSSKLPGLETTSDNSALLHTWTRFRHFSPQYALVSSFLETIREVVLPNKTSLGSRPDYMIPSPYC